MTLRAGRNGRWAGAIMALLGCLPWGGSLGAPATDAAAAVREVVAGIIAADNARDLGRVLDSYAEDAVLMPPKEAAIRGRAAIRPRYETLFRDFAPELSTSIEAVELAGDRAIVVGRNTGRLVPVRPGKARDVDDDFLMILRRGADGRWRITRLMWHAAAGPGGGGGSR